MAELECDESMTVEAIEAVGPDSQLDSFRYRYHLEKTEVLIQVSALAGRPIPDGSVLDLEISFWLEG